MLKLSVIVMAIVLITAPTFAGVLVIFDENAATEAGKGDFALCSPA